MGPAKTLFMYTSKHCGIVFFFQVISDKSFCHLDGVFIDERGVDPKLSEELNDFLYELMEPLDEFKFKKLDKPTKDWDHFVRVGDAW